MKQEKSNKSNALPVLFRRTPSIPLIALTALLVTSPVFAADPLGKTILARGSIVAERNNAQEALRRQSPVFQQDVLRSSANARAQFRMIDNALINLQQNSVLRLHDYKLENPSGDGSVLMELISGGLRTVTGAIGKKDKKDYQLRTPTATIGIRGTLYEVEIVSDGMYIAAWNGSIQVQSHSGQCDIELGDSSQHRFLFVNNDGACTQQTAIPQVFREGHSSDVTPETTSAIAESGVVIQPLTENPDIELPYRAMALGYADNVVDKGQANSISSNTPIIVTTDNGVFTAGDGTILAFNQNIGGSDRNYQLSWGHWADYINSPDLEGQATPVDDDNGLLWMTYLATDADVVESRDGTVRYETVVDSLTQSSMGAVSNLAVQMDVDFDDASVTNGALSAHVPNYTWVGVFDGQITGGDLSLQYNGGALVDANTGASSDASGFIDGDFVGNAAEGIAGGFSMTDTNHTDNTIEGFFVVEPN